MKPIHYVYQHYLVFRRHVHFLSILLSVISLLFARVGELDAAQECNYDVVIIGGTPAGVAAAIAAARADKTVIIIEQAPVLGGVLSSGVLRLDDKYVESNSGVMDEFRQRVKAYHRTEMADDPLVKGAYKAKPANALEHSSRPGLGTAHIDMDTKRSALGKLPQILPKPRQLHRVNLIFTRLDLRALRS